MPKVSVVIPVYNARQYLSKTLDSVLSQTLDDIEVICVDDGSSDGSRSILDEYASRDTRIRILTCEEDSPGAAAPRNMGIRESRGDYLSILDADDLFELDMLEKAYERITSTDSDIVIYDGWIYDDRTGEDGQADFILCRDFLPPFRDTFAPEDNADDLFMMAIGAAWGGMYRREFVTDNCIEFQPIQNADDFGFVFLAFACAKRISVIDEQLIHYRMYSGTSQSTKKAIITDSLPKALEELRDALDRRGLFERHRIAFVQFVVSYAGFYLDSMLEWPAFRDFFMQVKDEYFPEFGVYEVSDEQFRLPFWADLRNRIRDLSPEEFIFRMLVPAGSEV